MHHTDYSLNLRQAKHRANKLTATDSTYGNSTQKRHTNPLLAAAAVLLVLIAIFQMDPANAEPTMDIAGYGTLQFIDDAQAIKAKSVTNEIDLLIEDDFTTMMVSQTFINQTVQHQAGKYRLVLPENATVTAWKVQLESCSTRSRDDYHHMTPFQCEPEILAAQQFQSMATQIRDRFYIRTPTLAPNQRLSVQLDVQHASISSQLAVSPDTPPSQDQYDSAIVNSIAVASELIGLKQDKTGIPVF